MIAASGGGKGTRAVRAGTEICTTTTTGAAWPVTAYATERPRQWGVLIP
jgi:hypothetical protein